MDNSAGARAWVLCIHHMGKGMLPRLLPPPFFSDEPINLLIILLVGLQMYQ